MNEMTEKRTPELIGAEIRMYVNAGRAITMLCGIEIGRRLVEAKEMLQHGEWLPWLQKETEFSERSAQNYMKVFREYGAMQLGLFGPETNTQTFADLPISKALALLSVPESDRIEFAEEVDAEHLSVRELEEKIREREEQLAGAENRARDAEKLREETYAQLEERNRQLSKVKDQVVELVKKNKELEARPVEVAVETVRDEKAIEEAVEKAAKDYEKTVDDLNAKLLKAEKERDSLKKKAESVGSEADKKIEAANREAERIRAELEEAKKQLKTSESDVVAFGIHFNSVQSEWSYLMAELRKAEKRDQSTGEKLREAVRQLLEYLKEEAGK